MNSKIDSDAINCGSTSACRDNQGHTEMKAEQELQQLKGELEKLTGFIADFGTQEEFESKGITFANDLIDSIAWVLGEIATSDFRGDAYLNIARLQSIAKAIEQRTGKKLTNHA